jgi:hypothetical protein
MNEEKKKQGRGGARKGAGRKPKRDEEKVIKLGMDAIVEVYGSQESFFIHLATNSKESFPHLKLLMEYVYGKPKEKQEISLSEDTTAVPVISWVKSEDSEQ